MSYHLLPEIHERLGYKRLSPIWAKIEIVLGLFATVVGLLLGVGAVQQGVTEVSYGLAAVGVFLFVLGGYLTLAGHRSHLYQSENSRLALLIEEIRRIGGDTQLSPPRR